MRGAVFHHEVSSCSVLIELYIEVNNIMDNNCQLWRMRMIRVRV